MTDLSVIAQRIIGDLMPIAVVTAGESAAELAALMNASGASAEVFSAQTGDGFDLAVLRADPLVLENPAAKASLERLAAISQRFLFWPQSEEGEHFASDDLIPWFETLADLGFQPVVEFDAAYIAQGAFLVDREATASESELEIFSQRMALGGALAATEERVAALEAELSDGGDRAALKAALSAHETALSARGEELAARNVQLAEARARITTMENTMAAEREVRAQEQAVMARLAEWIRAVCMHPARFAGPKLGFFAKKPEKDAARAAASVRARPGYDPIAAILANAKLAQTGDDPARYLARNQQGFSQKPVISGAPPQKDLRH